MTIFLYHFLNSVAFASPGSGHSHADEDAMASKIIGIVIILVISVVVFWFLSSKKK